MSESDTDNGTELPVGEYLKSVRESRGIGLDEASRVTKIGKNYLAALEQEKFDKLPNAAYIKGFLRLYATFLGLSGDDVVRRYEQRLPAGSRPQPELKAERPGVEIMERTRHAGHGRWLIPVLLLVLVILAALFFNEGGEKQARRTPEPPQPAPAAPAAPAPAAVLPNRSSAAPATAPVPGASPAPGQAATPAPVPAVAPALPPGEKKPGSIVLRLRFNRDSWLSITIDDSITQRYDLKAGDIIEWKGTKSFVLDVGDGGAVEAQFNGRTLKTLGEPGKPAHVVLKGE